MYAAAGGASIASRRKQKRLVLQKRGGGSGTGSGIGAGAGRGCASVVPTNEHHGGGRVPGGANVGGAVAAPAVPSGSFHHHHNHHHHQTPRIRSAPFPSRTSRISRPPNLPPPLITHSGRNQNQIPRTDHHHNHNHNYNHNQHQQLQIPISPAITFPISPPALSISLESSKSLTYSVSKTNHFPFPPPSDLRISSSTDLQCSGQSQTQGKAAWQGCSRPSPLPLTPVSPLGSRAGDGSNYKTKQCEAHRRWMKRNRIRDASYCYGSSGEDEEDGQEYIGGGRRRGEVSAAVNTVLYAGLGTTALGLVISFVGTGEKGFQSSELRLVGPSLLCAGLLCCLLRVLLCLCLCHCGKCQWRSGKKASEKLSKDIKQDQNNIIPLAPSLLTASLLPPLRATVSQPQPQPQPAPSQPVAKGRELLLSAAQLSE